MGTEVQFKMFFPGYHFTNDVNDKAGNGSSLLGYSNGIMKNGDHYNGLPRWSKPDLHLGCEKEELREIILTQESVFRHQLKELHRLYKIQKDLMNEMKFKDLRESTTTLPSSLFSSCDKSKQYNYISHLGFPNSQNILKSDETATASESKAYGTLGRRLFDLELPAEDYRIQDQRFKTLPRTNLVTEGLLSSTSADIEFTHRGRVPSSEYSAISQASFPERVNTVKPRSGGSFFCQSLSGEIEVMPVLSHCRGSEMQTGQKIFGVEISHGTVSTGLSTKPTKPIQRPLIVERGKLIRGPGEGGSPYQMSTDSLLINFNQFNNGMSRTKPSTPLSLIQDSSSATGISYSDKRKVEVNGCSGNEKNLMSYGKSISSGRVGSNVMDHFKCPQSAASDKKITEKNLNACRASLREFFDLNVCPTEEAACSTLCSGTDFIKRVTRHIDLETPAQETDETPREESTGSKQGSSMMVDDKLGEEIGLLKVAAETLVGISSVCANNIEQTFPEKSEQVPSDILEWFAETITCSLSENSGTGLLNQATQIPEGMDDFEFATLNLAETEVEELSYKPPAILEEPQESPSSGRPLSGYRKRGRQKRDFQRDVLPGLSSLSRNEVSEDLQLIDGLIRARSGDSRTSLSRKNGASKGSKQRGRTKRRNSGCTDLITHSPVVEKLECRVIKEGTLIGWGKRGRRPKRARCSAAIYSGQQKQVF